MFISTRNPFRSWVILKFDRNPRWPPYNL